jgi:hypothetical protein
LQSRSIDGIVVVNGPDARTCEGRESGKRAQNSRRPLPGRFRRGVLPDSGAILRRLGITPHSAREFVLGNGDVVRRRLATATFEYQGQRGDSLVIVGEPGDAPLLGATTLEGFGLVLDPFRRELRPMQLTLKTSR